MISFVVEITFKDRGKSLAVLKRRYYRCDAKDEDAAAAKAKAWVLGYWAECPGAFPAPPFCVKAFPLLEMI